MKVLVAGSGGREHALCWKLAQSPLVTQLFCVPGNAGIAEIATCESGDVVEIARKVGADFVVVGPDGMLADGLIDRLQDAGIAAFGADAGSGATRIVEDFLQIADAEIWRPNRRFSRF